MRCGRSDMQASTSGREASASNNLNPNCCRAFPGSRVPAKKCPWNYLVVSSHSNRGSTGRCASKVQPIATASTDSHVTFVPAEEGGKIDGPASMSNQQGNHGGQAWLNSSSASQSPGESKLAAAAVDAKLAELRALVEAQNAVIQQQQHMLERLAAVQASAFSVPNASMLGAPVPSNSPPQQQQQRPSPFDAQRVAYGDRRLNGEYDARFHSTSAGATPEDYRVLPARIILVRHAESEGNVNNVAYTYIPDSQVPLTANGHQQARDAGRAIKSFLDAKGGDHRLFFYLSPYKRSLQTYEGISSVFASERISGVQEEVQLREQDFGNFQDMQDKAKEKAERVRFGRFFYRFPNGESGADVYDRITIFEDHMIRDINAGRFGGNTTLVLVTHGLALRVFLMRWFHWTVDEFMSVYNPANAEPLVLERITQDGGAGRVSWMHTKSLYRLVDESKARLKGCTDDMCSTSHMPRDASVAGGRISVP